MIRKSKILSDTLMVRSYVVTSELACRNGWLGMYCYLGSTQLKNSTVYKSTKCKTRVWMTNNSQKNTALNPGTQSCSRDSLRRKYRTGCLLPWSKVNFMAPKVRFPLVALLWLVLREKNIAGGKVTVAAIEHAKLQTMDSSPSYESTGSYQAFRLETKIKWNDKIFLNFLFSEVEEKTSFSIFCIADNAERQLLRMWENVNKKKKKKRLESTDSSQFHF